jgi:hypothetical protein
VSVIVFTIMTERIPDRLRKGFKWSMKFLGLESPSDSVVESTLDTLASATQPRILKRSAVEKKTATRDHRSFFTVKREPIIEPTYDYYVVIADDVEKERRNTKQAIEAVLSTKAGNTQVITPDKGGDFFRLALTGNAGKPADLVLLDDAYRSAYMNWLVTPKMMQAITEPLEADFSPYLPPDRGRSILIGQMPDDLYNNPGSINFALLLRAAGFTGKIFVVSSDPPLAEKIAEQAKRLKKAVPVFSEEFPIEGITYKKHLNGSIEYATETKDGRSWNLQELKWGEANLETTLRRMLNFS